MAFLQWLCFVIYSLWDGLGSCRLLFSLGACRVVGGIDSVPHYCVDQMRDLVDGGAHLGARVERGRRHRCGQDVVLEIMPGQKGGPTCQYRPQYRCGWRRSHWTDVSSVFVEVLEASVWRWRLSAHRVRAIHMVRVLLERCAACALQTGSFRSVSR